MQDGKHGKWANGNGAPPESAERNGKRVHSGDNKEGDGWQQYRKWISKAPVTRGRRNGLDPSLYTWKGYRSWTEQVKRNWSDN